MISFIDPCIPNPCETGNVCKHKLLSNGTAGHTCENPCDKNPCQHNGTCTKDGNGGHECDCATTGYSGVNCTHGKRSQ